MHETYEDNQIIYLTAPAVAKAIVVVLDFLQTFSPRVALLRNRILIRAS